MIYAHRLSYEMHNGAIRKGLLVLHTCDEPRCVNPKHLVLGTSKENSADMVAKGRASHVSRTPGVQNRHAKLTEKDVRAIRRARERGIPTGELAKRHGVTRAMIFRIESRRAWAHLP